MNRLRTTVLAFALTLVAPAASLAAPAPTQAPAAHAQIVPAALQDVLSTWESGPQLAVVRSADGMQILDDLSGRILLSWGADGLVIAADDLQLTPEGRTQTRVVSDPNGSVRYTQAVTAMGATVTVIPAGELGPRGLDVLTFDNDDVHMTDDTGALVFSRQTLADGTIVEQVGLDYGCGCERVTDVFGATVTRPLR